MNPILSSTYYITHGKQLKSVFFLINCYTDIFEMTNTHIILRNEGGIEINDVFLDLLFKEISKYEDYYFSKKLPKHLDNWSRRRCPFSDPYQAEIWELENMKCFEVEDPK